MVNDNDVPTSDESLQLHKHLLSGWRFKTLIVTIILSIIGYFLFTIWAGWEHVIDALFQVGFSGIFIALSLSLINYGLRFCRWQLFLKTLGHKIPWAQSLRIYISGFALTPTPGKTGEALRGVFLKDLGIPFRKSFGAFLSERFFDLLAVLILACAGLWIHPEARPLLFVVALILLLILYTVQKDSWLKSLEKTAKRFLPSRFAKTIEFLLEMTIAFRCCFSKKILVSALILGVLAWGAEGVALYTLLHFLGYDLNLLSALFIYGFSLVIGGITLLPGGLGGAEVTMLQLLMVYDIPASSAVALTLVIRITTLWFSVILGFIALPKKLILLKG